jgi:hypothetical protein
LYHILYVEYPPKAGGDFIYEEVSLTGKTPLTGGKRNSYFVGNIRVIF